MYLKPKHYISRIFSIELRLSRGEENNFFVYLSLLFSFPEGAQAFISRILRKVMINKPFMI